MERLCNKKLMASSLMEWTLGSETTFIDAKGNDILVEKAKKMGIELPSPDLAAFETVYCEVDKFNRNGVKFSKEVAQKGLSTLLGKQINWNHSGANQICGYMIDAEIKEDKIYVTGILFKSLFRAEFDEVVQLFASKQLFVSFELWNRKEDGTSIILDLGNGQRELTQFMAHGCALLLIDPNTGDPIPPACPEAQVKKLLASTKVIEEAESIVEKIFNQDESLVYAELATQDSPTCTKCAHCTCHNEGGNDNIMEEIEIVKDIKVQETPEQAQVEQPASVEEPKVDAAVTEPIVEVPVAEVSPEVPTEVVPPEQAQVVDAPVAVVDKKVVRTIMEDSDISVEVDGQCQRKRHTKLTREFDDGTNEVVEEDVESIIRYTQAELDAKLLEAKQEILTLKDAEIKILQETKEQEIATLKKELEPKPQEVKLEVAKEEKPLDLSVGNSETKSMDQIIARRKELNMIAYGHDNEGR